MDDRQTDNFDQPGFDCAVCDPAGSDARFPVSESDGVAPAADTVPAQLGQGPLVEAVNAQRCLRRLLAAGYSANELLAALGLPSDAALPFDTRQVTLAMDARVGLLYEDLRLVKAQRSVSQLAALRHEGFRTGALERSMAEVALNNGGKAPSLDIEQSKIPARTARLIDELYHRLMA